MTESRTGPLSWSAATGLLVIAGALGYGAIIAAPDMWARWMIFLAFAGLCIWLGREDIAHPFVWFIPVYALYAIAAPIGNAITELPTVPLHRSVVEVQYLGLWGFATGAALLSSGSNPSYRRVGNPPPYTPYLFPLLWLALVTALCVTAVFGLSMWLLGDISKPELMRTGSVIFRTQASVSLLFLGVFGLLMLRRFRKGTGGYFTMLVVTGVYALLLSYLSDERDIVVRYMVIAVFVVHMVERQLRLRALIFSGVVCIAALGALGMHRSVQAFGGPQATVITRILDNSLLGEFYFVSSNLSRVIEEFETGGVEPLQGQTLLRGLSGAVLPTSWELPFMSAETATVWFNRMFFPEAYRAGHGRGFSLVAEGYANFGRPGAFLLLCLVSVLLHAAYSARSHPMVAVAYVVALPGVLYAIRGDVASIMAFGVKQSAAPALVMATVAWFAMWADRKIDGRLHGADLMNGKEYGQR
jgi:hypothetical protein